MKLKQKINLKESLALTTVRACESVIIIMLDIISIRLNNLNFCLNFSEINLVVIVISL